MFKKSSIFLILFSYWIRLYEGKEKVGIHHISRDFPDVQEFQKMKGVESNKGKGSVPQTLMQERSTPFFFIRFL